MATDIKEVKLKLEEPLIFSSGMQRIEKDYLLSIDELKERAAKGNASAQLLVGLSLKHGWYGLVIDEEEGNKWIGRIKKDESAVGLCAQGLCSEFAIGGATIKNPDRAKECYTKAVEKGLAPAMFCLGSILIREEEENTSTNKTEIEGYHGSTTIEHVNQQKRDTIRTVLISASEAGFLPCQGLLARCYYKGLGVKQDFKEARRLFLPAAEAGDAYSRNYMGVFYHNGEGVEPNYAEARKWYQLAVSQKEEWAQKNIEKVSGCWGWECWHSSDCSIM